MESLSLKIKTSAGFSPLFILRIIILPFPGPPGPISPLKSSVMIFNSLPSGPPPRRSFLLTSIRTILFFLPPPDIFSSNESDNFLISASAFWMSEYFLSITFSFPFSITTIFIVASFFVSCAKELMHSKVNNEVNNKFFIHFCFCCAANLHNPFCSKMLRNVKLAANLLFITLKF